MSDKSDKGWWKPGTKHSCGKEPVFISREAALQIEADRQASERARWGEAIEPQPAVFGYFCTCQGMWLDRRVARPPAPKPTAVKRAFDDLVFDLPRHGPVIEND